MEAFTPCDPCLRSSKRQVAENWCAACVKYLCSDCTSHHKKLTFLINHSLMPIKVKQRLNHKIHELPVTCDLHKDQHFSFYCPYHKALCCEQCRNIDHGNCSSVIEIEKAAIKLSFLHQFQNHVTQTKNKLKEILDIRNAEKQSMEDENNRIQNEIKSFRQEINNTLDELERNVVQRLTTVHNDRISNIDFSRQQLLDIEADLNCMSKDVDILYQNVSNNHLFVVVTLLSNKIRDHSNYVSTLSCERETNQLTWNKPDILPKIKDFGSIDSESFQKHDARSNMNEKVLKANKESSPHVSSITNYCSKCEDRSRKVAVHDLDVLTEANILEPVQDVGNYCNQRGKRKHGTGSTMSLLEMNANKRLKRKRQSKPTLHNYGKLLGKIKCKTSSSMKRKPLVTRHIVTVEEESIDEDSRKTNSEPSDPGETENKNEIPEDLPEGTVICETEAIEESTFKRPEFPTKEKISEVTGYPATVHCSACREQINTSRKGDARRHPELGVLICRRCLKFHTSKPIEQGKDGVDEHCRWCSEEGSLFGCDYCHNAFCTSCIKTNLGQAEFSRVKYAEKFKCYVCNPEPLAAMMEQCNSVIDTIEKELTKKYEMAKKKKEIVEKQKPSGKTSGSKYKTPKVVDTSKSLLIKLPGIVNKFQNTSTTEAENDAAHLELLQELQEMSGTLETTVKAKDDKKADTKNVLTKVEADIKKDQKKNESSEKSSSKESYYESPDNSKKKFRCRYKHRENNPVKKGLNAF